MRVRVRVRVKIKERMWVIDWVWLAGRHGVRVLGRGARACDAGRRLVGFGSLKGAM